MRFGVEAARRRVRRAGRGARRAGLGVALAVGVSLLLTSTAPVAAQAAPPAPTSFGDVAGVAWAEPAIALLAAEGVVHGTAPGTFDPGGVLTAEQAALFLSRLFTGQITTPQGGLNQIGPQNVDSWAQAAVDWMVNRGVVHHPSAFNGKAPAPRAQVTAWVVRVLGLTGSSAPTFADASAIPADYAQEVGVAQAAGLVMGGPNGNFHPASPITRAQLTVILVRAERVLAMAQPSSGTLFKWSMEQGNVSTTVTTGHVATGAAKLPAATLSAGTVSDAANSLHLDYLEARGIGTGSVEVSGSGGHTWALLWQSAQGLTPGTLWVFAGGAQPLVYSYLATAGGPTIFQANGAALSYHLPDSGSVQATQSQSGSESATLCETVCTSGGTSYTYEGPQLPVPALWALEIGAHAILAPGS